jgi:hypothetical protein
MLDAADKAAVVKHGVEGPRSRLPRTTRCSIQVYRTGAPAPTTSLVGCGEAEAGGSPSSEAPPDDALVVCRTGREPGVVIVDASARAGTPRRRKATQQEGSALGNRAAYKGARVESRLQKSERRIFLARGITRDTIKIGTIIVVDGFRSKDGTMRANGRDITFPDGKTLFMGSSGTGAPRDGRDPTETPK